MRIPSQVDVAIVGAGPGGLTCASLLRKYRPETSLVVLERERLPRHRIGESLIVDVNRILADMDAVDAVEQAGFSKKYGVTFAWGCDRATWPFLWCPPGEEPRRGPGYQLEYTWHVDRHRYDALLAAHVRAQGVDVLEGVDVTSVTMDQDRVSGLSLSSADGEGELRARWVVDAGGNGGPVMRRMGGRRIDAGLRNLALFGYFRGVPLIPALTGEGAARRTAILLHPRGWVWVIPLSGGITSVGFVTTLATFQAEGGDADPAAHYHQRLAELPEHALLFRDAELVDYRGDGKLVRWVQEYSYSCERVRGPGWASCGDASGFVDAILSVGVFLSQAHAQFLAYALASVLDGQTDEDLAMRSYARTVDDDLSAFRLAAYFFYAFNDTLTDWWRDCSLRLLDGGYLADRADRDALVGFISGFSTRSSLYEEAVNAFGGAFLADVDNRLHHGGVPSEDSVASRMGVARALVASDPRLELAGKTTCTPFALPASGTGRLATVTRMDIEIESTAPLARAGVARRIYLPEYLASVPERLTGGLRLSEVARSGLGPGAPAGPETRRREVQQLAYRLLCMGAARRAAEPRR
jgi:flavin-dependent dehydrogenase